MDRQIKVTNRFSMAYDNAKPGRLVPPACFAPPRPVQDGRGHDDYWHEAPLKVKCRGAIRRLRRSGGAPSI